MIGMSVATTALRERPRMEQLAEVARARARRLGRPVLVSVTTKLKMHDPLALFARAMGATHNRFFWSVPSAGVALAGLGSAWHYEASGANPFPAAQAAWQELMESAAIGAEADLPFAGPLAAAGFAFDPTRPAGAEWAGFPQGALVLPRIVLARIGDQASLTVNGMVGAKTSTMALAAGAARRLQALLGSWRANHQITDLHLHDALPAEQWQGIVGRAVAELQAERMEKVVLARQVDVSADHPFDLPTALETLRRDYPDTFVFAVARGGRTFLGASPERLVSLRDGAVSAFGLAGSSARGATPEQDAELGAALLRSAKDRTEHAVVVRTILEDLNEICHDLQAPSEPTLMKVRNVQHLFTPISGTIRANGTIFDLLERLHPTPAVGGRPRELALEWIRQHEQLDRGWYAGPVGWVNAKGEGEFAVALRSALAERNQAHLFAGCGIVASSDPQREYQETQIKLRAMLGALSGR